MQNGGTAGATTSQRLRFGTARDLFEAFPTASEDIAADADRSAVARLHGRPGGRADAGRRHYLLRLSAAASRSRLVGAPMPRWRRRTAVARRRPHCWRWRRTGCAIPRKTSAAPSSMPAWRRRPRRRACGSHLLPAGAAAACCRRIVQPVEPPPYLTAKAANAGVLSALARVDRKSRAATLKQFVNMAMQLLTRSVSLPLLAMCRHGPLKYASY